MSGVLAVAFLFAALAGTVYPCTDFYMNFTDASGFKLSGRTLDLGTPRNWTVSTWPLGDRGLNAWAVKYGSVGLTANWFGDEKWLATSFFGDSLNTAGLSCSTLALVGTQYQERSDAKLNIFAGLFCHYAVQQFASVRDLQSALAGISIYGPDALAQHFVLRDASGASLVVEVVGGVQHVYLDLNDGVTGWGVTTNEPTFDWHLENVRLYEWKRSLARPATATPGNFYPDERLLRVHMVKQGMQRGGLMEADDYQTAFALTAQVLNTVTVPMGQQLGTDTGESSGEGTDDDHTLWGLVRDHATPTLYWRTAANPTFRRIVLSDVDLSEDAARRVEPLDSGPYFVDVSKNLRRYIV